VELHTHERTRCQQSEEWDVDDFVIDGVRKMPETWNLQQEQGSHAKHAAERLAPTNWHRSTKIRGKRRPSRCVRYIALNYFYEQVVGVKTHCTLYTLEVKVRQSSTPK